MSTAPTFTIREAVALRDGTVTVTVVDDALHLFHVTMPRRETDDVRLHAIVAHALDVRYPPIRPLGV